MTEPKLKAKLFVHAAIRRCAVLAIPVVVARKGDDDSGTILVRLTLGRDCARVYTQVRDGAGRLGWMCATGPEPVSDARADAYIDRAREVDWDLWVLDVDNPAGEVPFLEPMISA